jgi:hypothetical protein
MFTIAKTVTIALLIGTVSLAACAAQTAATYPPKDQPPATTTQPQAPVDAAGFKFDKNGFPVPVAADGTAFKVCSEGKRNNCSLFKENITLTKIEPIFILRAEHKINPTCAVYVMNVGGVQKMFYNPNDPNCAKFNQ